VCGRHDVVRRPGTTLVELLIVIVLMSLLAGVATVALAALRQKRLPSLEDVVGDSLRIAASTARPNVVVSDSFSAFVLPDGRVVADSMFHVELLTGRMAHAR
jgi:Tfp pilus assembly protein FimT